jgi:hypothetical protein
MPEASLAVFNGHMAHRPPIVAVVSDDHRVGRALVAYLSSNGSAAAQVIGPYTYHADQENSGRRKPSYATSTAATFQPPSI